MKPIVTFLLLITLSLYLQSCETKPKSEIDVSTIKVDVKIKRFEKEIFSLKSKQEIENFLKKNQQFALSFFQYSGKVEDSVTINEIYNRIKNTDLRKFEKQVETEYADIKDLENQFSNAFKHIKHYFPTFREPQIYTMVSGFLPEKDLTVSDSVIIIGLDYFMPPKAMYVPDLPEYMLKRYKHPYIVPISILALSGKYTRVDLADQTLLADMIGFGKSLQFTSYMLPQVPDSIIIGYTAQQLKDIEQTKELIWSHYVKEGLFYSTNHFIKPKYVGERPYTVEIGQSIPPRTGWWLGWQMVKKYMDKGHTLQETLANPDSKKIFTESGYKGK